VADTSGDDRRPLAETIGTAFNDWARGAFVAGHVRIEHQIDEIIATYLAAPGRDLLLLSTLVARAVTPRKMQALRAILEDAGLAEEFRELVGDLELLTRYRNIVAHGRGPLRPEQLADVGGPVEPAATSFWFVRYTERGRQLDEIDADRVQTLRGLLLGLPARLDELAERLGVAGD
jgi:hypothetical protein